MSNIDPNSRNALITVLNQANSKLQNELTDAVEQLKFWQTQTMFYPTLQDIAYDKELKVELRIQAMLYLKNGIDVFWRKTANNCLSPEDKNSIRNRLLSQLNEPEKRLSLQNSVIISKIARFDYPEEWPKLFEELIQIICNSSKYEDEQSKLVQLQGLRTLKLSIKELSSKVLSKAKEDFKKLSPILGQVIIPLFHNHYNKLKAMFQNHGLHNISTIENEVINQIQFCTLALKCLRLLIAKGTKEFNKIEIYKKFYLDSITCLKEVYELVKNLAGHADLIEHFIKLMKLFGKFHLDLQHEQPIQFVNTEGWLDIMLFYWALLNEQGVNELNDEISMVKCCIQGMLLIRDTVCNYSYMYEEKDKPDENLILVRKNIDTLFLTEERIVKLMELLILKFLTLNPNTDLFLWENDPETWISEDESDHWEYKYRKCAERLLASIIKQYKKWIGPMLLNILEQFKGPKDSLEQILIKDAIYNGIGLAAHELFSYMDFDTWFKDYLSKELLHNGPGQAILRYRITWLIGQWVVVKTKKEVRHVYYEALLYILSLDNERPESIIFRWSAANALKICIDDWDFETSVFHPYLANSVDNLINLMVALDEIDNKMKVIHYLSIIVERMEIEITPHAAKIANLLPALWQAVGAEQNLLKTAIVTMLTKLTKSLGQASENLHNMINPVVSQCIDFNNNAHIYLIEDGLELWLTSLKNTSILSPQLIQLIPNAINMLDNGSENLKIIIKILNSYLLLNAELVVQNYGELLFANLELILIHLRADASEFVNQLLDVLLVVTPAQVYQNHLVNSGLFASLVKHASNDNGFAYFQIGFIKVLSRLAIIDQVYFYLAMVQSFPQDYTVRFQTLLKQWIEKFDNISNLKASKIVCMAWSYLLAVPIDYNVNFTPFLDAMFNQLTEMFAYWSAFLVDIKESDEGDCLSYHQGNNYSDEEYSTNVNIVCEVERANKLIEIDPAHTIPLIPLLKQNLNLAKQNYDDFMLKQNINNRFQQLIDKIDPAILESVLGKI